MSKPKMAALNVLSLALYLAIAVAGEGGLEPYLAQPALVVLAVVTFLSGVIALFSDAGVRTGVREDRGNRWVLAVFAVLGLLDAFLPGYCDRKHIWPVDGQAGRWLGVALYAAGAALRIAPAFVLGRRFSGLVAIQPGHTLATTGLYSRIRNPSYLGMIVLMTGWGLAFNTWAGVLIAVLILFPMIARIKAEEKLLASQFGEEFAAWRARTWRLVPWVY